MLVLRAPLLALAGAAFLGACASSGGGTGAARPAERILIQSDEGFIRTTDAATMRVDSVPTAPTATMRALVATMEQMEIEVTLVAPAKGEVGNPRFVASRRLLDEPMSRFVSCGQTLTGLRADNDRIVFNILSTVAALPAGGSTVSTRVDAQAQDMQSGNSTALMQCTSTGLLEQRINEALRARLGR